MPNPAGAVAGAKVNACDVIIPIILPLTSINITGFLLPSESNNTVDRALVVANPSAVSGPINFHSPPS